MTIADLKQTITEAEIASYIKNSKLSFDGVELNIPIATKDEAIEVISLNKINLIIKENATAVVINAGSYGNKYSLNSESTLITLRELYKSTKNNFIKKVIVTVGKSKEFTEKQMDLIMDELVKFNNVSIG